MTLGPYTRIPIWDGSRSERFCTDAIPAAGAVFSNPERLRCRMNTTSPPPTDTDRRAEAARLAQRHNEALAKKPADNPRFKPAANVPGQGFVIVGPKR